MAHPPRRTQLLSKITALSLAACTGASNTAQSVSLREQSIQELQREAGAPVTLEVSETGETRVLAMTPRFPVPGHTIDPAAVAKDFLVTHASIFRLDATDAAQFAVTNVDNDPTTGQHHVSLNRIYDGIPVFQGAITVHMDSENRVYRVLGDGSYHIAVPTNRMMLSASEAAMAAGHALGVEISPVLAESDDNHAVFTSVGTLDPTRVDPKIFHLDQGGDRFAYQVIMSWLDEPKQQQYQLTMIDAQDGSLLASYSLVNTFTGRVFHAGAQPTANMTTDTRTVVSFDGDPAVSPQGWVGAARNTVGNNAVAATDVDGNNAVGTNETQPVANASNSFDFPFSPLQDASILKAAAVANAFFLVNDFHDRTYRLGFTESSRNFQANNFGKGGSQNDPVNVDAQDGAGTNNANFATPPDGSRPRMQMFLFTLNGGAREDGDFDPTVIYHENTHGLSNRLVGGGSTACLSGLQSGGMGEGWGDFMAASFLDNPVIGAYVTGNATVGIRQFSMANSPFSYADVQNGRLKEVHDLGELWAAALWDVRNGIGGTGGLGAATTERLVVQGMKLTPCNPTMLQARDGIVTADQNLNGGSNRCALFKAFANRGMGINASSPNHNATETITPSMDVPTECASATGTIAPISQLPSLESASTVQVQGERLRQTTALGETTALHVRLPPPRNPQLQSSLVRIVGDPSSPQVLFRSDALAQLGVTETNPGQDFFTAFATLPPSELSRVKEGQDQISAGAFGQITNESVVFQGRSAVARTINPTVDPAIFQPGSLVPVNRCAFRPLFTQAASDKALFIRHPAVVLDPARTWDPCTGAGTQGGAWTFAHLVREMANGSGSTPEDFVRNWLSLWLNSYTVNNDTVLPRTQMFNQVILPWATASGVTATLVTDASGQKIVTLSGPLNLNIAPFRLLAIVNRIDLGEAVRGGNAYSGSTTDVPVTAGELRFIFDVVQPNPWGPGGTEATCGRKRFTTIFEYGVPGTGCNAVVNWAKQWTTLLSFPGFTAGYLAQLQSMTESVVLHGAAPAKGNQNAINQIRTNEIALASPWELREFTLTAENPSTNTDPPVSGPLRAHTVAQTPNDSVLSALGADPAINAFVTGPVTAGVVPGLLNPLIPEDCKASFTVPFVFGTSAFRGGNAFTGPPVHWNTNSVNPGLPEQVCARHQFSLNTCNGCHHDDTGTNFTHIDVLGAPPVTLSLFLTGGGPVSTFNVPDTQGLPLGPPGAWPFADLRRRYDRLFELAFCTSCAFVIPSRSTFVDQIQNLGLVPIDPGPDSTFGFRVGPITDLSVVQLLLTLRSQFAGATRQEPVDFIRSVNTFAH